MCIKKDIAKIMFNYILFDCYLETIIECFRNWQQLAWSFLYRAKEKYRGVFEIQRSGDKRSSGEIGLDIRTHASPKVGQDQVSGEVSVPCWQKDTSMTLILLGVEIILKYHLKWSKYWLTFKVSHCLFIFLCSNPLLKMRMHLYLKRYIMWYMHSSK